MTGVTPMQRDLLGGVSSFVEHYLPAAKLVTSALV